MKLDLSDNVILIAGNSQELKDSIHMTLASEGATGVFIMGEPTTHLHQTASALSEDDGVFHFNTGDDPESSIRLAVEKIRKQYGRIDGLVMLPDLMDEPETMNTLRQSFPASVPQGLAYAYLLVLNTLPALKESKGALVNIYREPTPAGQIQTFADTALYGGHKALTREWAVELLKYNVRVNAVLIKDSGRISQSNSGEIASIVVFLMSSKSSHTTGQLLYADK